MTQPFSKSVVSENDKIISETLKEIKEKYYGTYEEDKGKDFIITEAVKIALDKAKAELRCWADDSPSFSCDNKVTRTLCEEHWKHAVNFFREQRTTDILKIIEDKIASCKNNNYGHLLDYKIDVLQDLTEKINGFSMHRNDSSSESQIELLGTDKEGKSVSSDVLAKTEKGSMLGRTSAPSQSLPSEMPKGDKEKKGVQNKLRAVSE